MCECSEGKRILLGQAVELVNTQGQELEADHSASLEEQWKVLTHNYLLRKKLLAKSINNTELLKQQI